MSHAPKHPETPANAALEWALSFARGYLELGMLARAESELRKLPPELQENPRVMSLRSHVLLARHRWRRVVAHARRAVSLFPHAPEYYIHAATALDMMGQPEEGRRVWALAPEPVRTSGFFHLHVARFEARLGNVHSARDHLASAFDLDPRLRSVAGRDPHLVPVLAVLTQN
jgi:predicted Zn-dependent protease